MEGMGMAGKTFNRNPWLKRGMLVCVLAALPLVAVAQHAGETVIKRGTIGDDVYAAGRVVDVDARVRGDVVAAGADVTLNGTVSQDALLAGGNLSLNGQVADDLRAAGGTLVIDLRVGDDLMAAGGDIRTSAATRVGGHAWLAGGTLDLSGDFANDLRAAGGDIRISGHVHGNAELAGENIRLLPGAVIDGNLVYRSEQAAVIEKGAIVRGTVTRKPYPSREHRAPSLGKGPGLVFLASLFLSAVFLALVFPRFSAASAERLQARPWASLGLGFVVLVATPPAAFLALVLVLTFLPGLVLMALYPVVLLAGFLIGVVWVGEVGARLIRRDAGASPGIRVLSLAVALVILGLLCLVPFLGGLVWFLLTLFGVGAGILQFSRQYSASA
jgi:cytoskeletal protein CcmA (bactofilin family)